MKIYPEDRYQIYLIALGVLTTIMLGLFLYREVAPEYLIYQKDYISLEKFRSEYTGSPPPDFHTGIKQIVIPAKNNGPEVIDRCVSCHVALQFPHFSPTKLTTDINGNIVYDAKGIPLQEANPDYVWLKLEEKIAELTDEAVNKQLLERGETAEVNRRLKEADKYKSCKVAHVEEHTYDVTRVLRMHPLIGKETRPFEYHPLEIYGCTSCHSGNGRGLVTDRAHGPVFEGTYEAHFEGPRPVFLESDEDNDPLYAQLYNHKPGDRLHFQTTPILVGNLIQSRCVQCHQPSSTQLSFLNANMRGYVKNKNQLIEKLEKSIQNDQNALSVLLQLRKNLSKLGYQGALAQLKQEAQNENQSDKKQQQIRNQLTYLLQIAKEQKGAEKGIQDKINEQLVLLIGSLSLAEELDNQLSGKEIDVDSVIQLFLDEQRQKGVKNQGTLFTKEEALSLAKATAQHIQDMQFPLREMGKDQRAITAMTTDIDLLTTTYQKGQQLFFSQGCYACHRIAGYSRGGVGPDLTAEGLNEPWFIKESVVWPQADLRTSTMPNVKMDHEELEAVMTYLLAQRNDNKTVGEATFQKHLNEWEGGQKMPWEEPLPPSEIYNVRNSMIIFATEGCASCHRLKGFESNVGFSVEKRPIQPSFDELYKERTWFSQLFPEDILGSKLVAVIDKHAEEIDLHIQDGVRKDSILEEIEKRFPEYIESFYSNFKFAFRAKNHHYDELAENEKDPTKKAAIIAQKAVWKERVHRILMMYIQEYGLGRLIGPRLNWSGVFRSDEWLMEHFWNPSSHSPRSLMPIFPFDESKFRALTFMLDSLAKHNREQLREIWDKRGFNPELAVQIHCAQCHGEFLQGNGPVAEWIYPIPKNLRNATFLRNLTKTQAAQSIIHGVMGTPMPPWGEIAVDKQQENKLPVLTREEVEQIVDWIFSQVQEEKASDTPSDLLKWHYTPEDLIQELKNEGDFRRLKPKKEAKQQEQHSFLREFLDCAKEKKYLASLTPAVVNDQEHEELEIFDIVPNPIPGAEKKAYYIKKNYYTKENLSAGEQFFNLNCAICHGKQGDGAGLRAEAMYDAKPRMLTNLDWLETRDDLRLLRSIKYGVPGTAMTAWGDLTTALQRMQLVMYIRSLSSDQQRRQELNKVLYQTFTTMSWQIEKAHIIEYEGLQAIGKEQQLLRQTLEDISSKIENGQKVSTETASLYEKQMQLLEKSTAKQKVHQQFETLLQLVKQEANLYKVLGESLIINEDLAPLFPSYLKLIQLNKERYLFENDKLLFFDEQAAKRLSLEKALVEEASASIHSLEQEKANAKLTGEEKKKIEEQIKSDSKLKGNMYTIFAETERLRKKQRDLLKKIPSENP